MNIESLLSYNMMGWLLIGGYAIVILGLVVRGSRTTLSIKDYALGSKGFSPTAVGLALAASMTSAATFIINPGFVAYYGISGVISMAVMLPLGALLSLVVLTKGFRRVGTSVKALTLSQWIGTRFNSKGFGMFFAFLSLLLLTFIVLICVGLTKVIATTLALNETYVLAGVVLFVFGYMMFGGANSMVYTNAIQAALMIVVALMLLGSGYEHFSQGLDGFIQKLSAIDENLGKPMNPESFLFRDFFEIVICQFLVGIAIVCQPHIITKSLLLKKSNQVNKYLTVGIITEILFFFVVIVGLYARLMMPDLQHNGQMLGVDNIIPVYVVEKFPLMLGLIVIMGLISAGLSTLEGLIQSLSTTISQDILKPLTAGKITKSGERDIMLNRLIIAALAGVSFGLSYQQLVAPDMSVAIFAQNGVYAFFSAAFIPVLVGMFFRNAPSWIPIIASVTALVTHFGVYYGRVTPYMQTEVRNPGVAAGIAIMAAIGITLIGFVVAKLTAKKDKQTTEKQSEKVLEEQVL
jgi:sodium/pantothenate symporter